MSEVILLGAGAHARVLASMLKAEAKTIRGCIALSPPDSSWPTDIAYLGGDDVLSKYDPTKVKLVFGIGAVAPSESRAHLFDRMKSAGFSFETLIDARALIAPDVHIEEGSVVLLGALLQTSSLVGKNTIINVGATIAHDCVIGSHAHVAPGVSLSGKVTVGDGVHIGTGASVIQGIRIGSNALVAAGAVVVRDVPAGARVAGVPARPTGARHA